MWQAPSLRAALASDTWRGVKCQRLALSLSGPQLNVYVSRYMASSRLVYTRPSTLTYIYTDCFRHQLRHGREEAGGVACPQRPRTHPEVCVNLMSSKGNRGGGQGSRLKRGCYCYICILSLTVAIELLAAQKTVILDTSHETQFQQ